MPSTYTVNLGIEKPATGEQSGTWGDTVNDNSNILDEAVNGVVSINLSSAGSSGSPNQIAITNGASSTGRNKWIEFTDGSDLGASAYVELIPNDAEKICFIRNSLRSSRSILLFQGTYNASNDLEVVAGTDVVVKFSGSGTGATVVNIYANLAVDALVASGEIIATGGITTGASILSDTDSTDSLGSTGVRWLKGWFDTLTAGTLTIGSGSVTDSSGAISLGNDNLTTTGIVTAAGTSVFTNLDISGDVDIDGTLNVDAIDIDGALQLDGALTVGVDDTGYDVKFFGDTASAFMLWDTSGDDLILGGAAQLGIGNGTTAPTAILDVRRADVSGKIAEFHQSAGYGLEFGSSQAQAYIQAGSLQTLLITVPSDMTIDSGGDIILDADGGDISFKDAGTEIGLLTNDSTNFGIFSRVNNADIKFYGLDDTSTITALALDMSAAGAATFSSTVTIPTTAYVGTSIVHQDDADTSIDFATNTMTHYSGGTRSLDLASSSAVFNEGGIDADFRVESADNANMLFVDASANSVGIGTANPTAPLHIDAAGMGDVYSGLVQNSTTDTDHYNVVRFMQGASGSATGLIGTGGSATGNVAFRNTFVVGTESEHALVLTTHGAERFRISSAGDAVFNEGGADADFRVESDGNAAMLFVDGANNNVGIGTSSPNITGFGSGTNGLEIADATIAGIRLNGNAADSMYLVSGAEKHWVFGRGAVPMSFSTNGLERFAIAADGSLSTTTLGTDNVRFGVNAGNSIASGGNDNVLLGKNAGTAITTGDSNVAIGTDALMTEDAHANNIAIGQWALKTLNAGADGYNVAVGYYAGTALQTGVHNVLIGGLAGDATVEGDTNVAVGYLALSAICGDNNTAVGPEALKVCTGDANTSLGKNSGNAVTSGDNNLLLGRDAGVSGSPGGAISTGSDAIVLGDENIGNAHIQVDWTVASDARDKTDFTALDLGLDFVKALAPVTYKWDKRSKYIDKTDVTTYDDDGNIDHEGWDITTDLNAITHDGTHKEDWLDVGFKAQEIEALEIAAGYNKDNNTNLVSSHTGDGKSMGLQYSKFVPILVKAIQEQQTLIEALTARIETLEGV